MSVIAALGEEPDIEALLSKRARMDEGAGQGHSRSSPFVVDAIPTLPAPQGAGDVLPQLTGGAAARSDHRLLLSVFESIACHKLAEVFQVSTLSGWGTSWAISRFCSAHRLLLIGARHGGRGARIQRCHPQAHVSVRDSGQTPRRHYFQHH